MTDNNDFPDFEDIPVDAPETPENLNDFPFHLYAGKQPLLMGDKVVGAIEIDLETGELTGHVMPEFTRLLAIAFKQEDISISFHGRHVNPGVDIATMQDAFREEQERPDRNSMQVKVEQFMRAGGQDIQTIPNTDIPEETKALRKALMVEELTGKLELLEAIDADDIVLIADGIADLLYVVIGTASAYGLDIQEIFDEAHRSNMTKTLWDEVEKVYTVIKNDAGKIMKPPHFEEADFGAVVQKQITRGERLLALESGKPFVEITKTDE